jgi:hypothetical protein
MSILHCAGKLVRGCLPLEQLTIAAKEPNRVVPDQLLEILVHDRSQRAWCRRVADLCQQESVQPQKLLLWYNPERR